MTKKFDLYEALKAEGFYEANDEFGDILRKDYQKEIDVLWYGRTNSYLVVKVRFNADHSVAQASYYYDKIPTSRNEFKHKTHLNEKRAYNAIKQTVENKEFEF